MLGCVVLWTSAAWADPPAPEPVRPALTAGGFLPLRPARLLMSLGSGGAWLDKQAAADHHIGDDSATFNGTLAVTIQDVFMISTSFAFAFPTDYSSFTQVVMPQMGGDLQSAESSLSVVSYSIAAGLRTPFWALAATDHDWVAGALFATYGGAGFHSTRSISNCVDCRQDDFDLPGGTFLQVGVDLRIPSRKPSLSYGLTAAYQRYFGGAGFTQEFRIAFSCWLQ